MDKQDEMGHTKHTREQSSEVIKKKEAQVEGMGGVRVGETRR